MVVPEIVGVVGVVVVALFGGVVIVVVAESFMPKVMVEVPQVVGGEGECGVGEGAKLPGAPFAHFFLLLARATSSAKEFVRGASIQMLPGRPHSYWTLVASFTNLPSSMRRMWPSHL